MTAPMPMGDGPLIPMPELTVAAVRHAIARIAPSRIHAFDEHLAEAATNAQQTQSLAPLRAFIHVWAINVAIARYPTRAARFHALEALIDAGNEDPTDALAEIQQILQAAKGDAGL
ncbi:DUF6247 family protein [Streptomyces sp. NBC_01443]|uniref:DUF6247 family protein n=1 Tax=Streptomyces sp. NBC_01443 TaxID=2903868 RepID=UPI0022551FA7|nr:DUF6247 family protein [Streptomyces sp. NBC_01443]MCX4629606.1 DUF6247 family protein [Streptomyces sp. NBC_01443]